MPALHIIILLIVILHVNAYSQKFTPIFKKDYSHRLEARNTLIAFVGEKISWEQMPYERGSMDAGFKATYKIIQMVYGDYKTDTVSFEAYDHYGVPPFLQYKNALLYLRKIDGVYYHVKYIFSDVYKTKNGRWAGPYPRSYSPIDDISIKPERIEFAERVAFELAFECDDGMIRCFDYAFPSPYFRIEGDSAIAEYGNYIEELFLNEKEGSLKERKLFGDSLIEQKRIVVQDVQLEPITIEDEARVARFEPYAQKFINDLMSANFQSIKAQLADSVRSCDSLLNNEDFMKVNQHRLFNIDFLKEVEVGRKLISDLSIQWSSGRKNLVRFSIDLRFRELKPNQYELVSYSDALDPNCQKGHYDPSLDFSGIDRMMMGN